MELESSKPQFGVASPSARSLDPNRELAIIHETQEMTKLYLEEAQRQGKTIKDKGLAFQSVAQEMIFRRYTVDDETKAYGKPSETSQKYFEQAKEKYVGAVNDLSKPEEKQGISLGKLTEEGFAAFREARKAIAQTVDHVIHHDDEQGARLGG